MRYFSLETNCNYISLLNSFWHNCFFVKAESVHELGHLREARIHQLRFNQARNGCGPRSPENKSFEHQPFPGILRSPNLGLSTPLKSVNICQYHISLEGKENHPCCHCELLLLSFLCFPILSMSIFMRIVINVCSIITVNTILVIVVIIIIIKIIIIFIFFFSFSSSSFSFSSLLYTALLILIVSIIITTSGALQKSFLKRGGLPSLTLR